MFNTRTISVIKRELRAYLLSKSFIIMTLLVPVFMIVIIGIQTLIQSTGDAKANLIIASESQNITDSLKIEFENQEFVKSGFYTINYTTIDSSELQDFIDKNKKNMLDGNLSGIVFIPSSAEKNKDLSFYSKNPKDYKLFQTIENNINKVLLGNYFKNRQLTGADIAYATGKINFKQLKVSEDKKIAEEGYGNLIVSFLFTFLLYFSLIIFGSRMLQAVIEEKSNRIVEVLLSSINSTELLTGKILGTSITGLIQMAIWLLPVFLVVSTTLFVLPPQFIVSISTGKLIFYLLNYFIALVTYVGLYAAVGSIFTNPQDAQGGMWPLMLLIMIPFFIAIAMYSNPTNQIAYIASMIPFASLIVMPARITIMEVPAWQFILAILVNISVMLLIFPIAGKIFRVGILSTGKKPKWSEVIKWLRFKY